jgi:AcrR family transcriptional regulator
VPRSAPDALRTILRDFRRDQIVVTATRLFGERGSTEVAMDEIASEAGVARSTVYVYFPNRDELLRACLRRMHGQVLDAIVGSWDDDADPVRRLRTLAAGLLERIDENPAFFRLAVAAQTRVDDVGSTVGAELSLIGLDMARIIRDLVVEGIEAGVLRPVDPEQATRLVGQQLFGAMSVRAGEPLPPPVEGAAAELCSFVLRGIGATTR